MILNILLLLVGVFAASTSILMIKSSTIHPFLLAGWRQIFAAILLLPVFLRQMKQEKVPFRQLKQSILPGIVLGMHFMTWIIAGRIIPAANSTLIVNMVPIAMPFWILVLHREGLTKIEVIGTVLAVSGVMLLGWSDVNLSIEYLLGDLICLASMLLFALYMALGRRSKSGIWTYVVPLYLTGGVFCLIAASFFVPIFEGLSGQNLLMTLGLALVPTIVGHTIINRSMRIMKPQHVSLINLSQFVFAAVMAWLLFKEAPVAVFYPAAALIVSGAAVVILLDRKREVRKATKA